MSKRQRTKEIKIVGPTLLIGGSEVVNFETKFRSNSTDLLTIETLNSEALEMHNAFVRSVSALVSGPTNDGLVKEEIRSED